MEFKELGLQFVSGGPVTIMKYFFEADGQIEYLRVGIKNGKVRMSEALESVAAQLEMDATQLKLDIEQANKNNKVY